jgi:phosphatidylglycerophosphate synthase
MKEAKYQFSKTGKKALIVVLIALSLALLSMILLMLGVKIGVILVAMAIGANLVAMIGMAVYIFDRIKRERINNPEKLSKELVNVGYFIAGIIVGIMYCVIF